MDQSKDIDDPVLSALYRLLPNAGLRPTVTASSQSNEPLISVDLPVPVNSEYGFRLFLRPERQIVALLIESEPMDDFWYMDFEEAAFPDSLDVLDKVFVQTVELLIHAETRIVQRRGLIFESFRCDYRSETGWKKVYAHSYWRFGGLRLPLISRRERIYKSPAIYPRS